MNKAVQAAHALMDALNITEPCIMQIDIDRTEADETLIYLEVIEYTGLHGSEASTYCLHIEPAVLLDVYKS